MLNKKEIITIIVITIVLGFAISLIKSLKIFLYTSLAVFFVLMINIFAKKITSYYLDSKIEMKFWEIERTGFLYFVGFIPFVKTHPSAKFKRPFPIGIFLPIITAVLSLGYLIWMACLTFDVKPKVYRAAKRFKLYSFTEMTEKHIALIAAAGILANLVFALIGYLIGFTDFAKINIFFAFFNMLPISNLDGNKIFFGSLVLWSFLAAIVLIGLFYTIFAI